MTRVQHIQKPSVGDAPSSYILERTDPRLVSLSGGQVYFVPESRLLKQQDAMNELRRYKDETKYSMRS